MYADLVETMLEPFICYAAVEAGLTYKKGGIEK